MAALLVVLHGIATEERVYREELCCQWGVFGSLLHPGYRTTAMYLNGIWINSQESKCLQSQAMRSPDLGVTIGLQRDNITSARVPSAILAKHLRKAN